MRASDLIDAIKRHVGDMMAMRGQTRFGLVTSINPDAAQIKVNLQPDNVPTGWLPVKMAMIGNGWGLHCPPNIGDQAVLEPHEGSAENLICTGYVYSTSQRPPQGAKNGEMWLVHQSGQSIKLLNDGGIHSNGLWTHTGDLNVTGIITATGDVVADNGASIVSLTMHQHTSETPGTPTSTPIPGT